MLVKVLAVEGNRIRLSRKAILKEQRAKMGGGEVPPAPEGGEAEPQAEASLQRAGSDHRRRRRFSGRSGAELQSR